MARGSRGFGITLAVIGCVLAVLADRPSFASEDVVPNPPASFELIPGEVLIGFNAPPTPENLAAVERAVPDVVGWFPAYPYPSPAGAGVRSMARATPLPPHPLALRRKARLLPDADVEAVAARIEAVLGVDWAAPNGRTHPAFVPNDGRYDLQYGPQIIGAEDAWDIIPGGSNAIIIAIADTGLNFIHEDFQDRAVWINRGEIPDNGIDDDDNGFIDDVRGWDFMNDDNLPEATGSHGSHVAGIAAARLNNRVGIAGIAGAATIMPLQVFNNGGGTWEAIELAVIYATDNGASVINYSGGGPGGTPGLSRAVVYAHDHGVSVVAAAGNSDSDRKFFPAAYPTVLAISGTDRNDARYSRGNFGNWIDVAAPAVSIHSTLGTGNRSYGNMTGTSMASPHVAGLVALMLSINPSMAPDDVRQRLRDNAVDLGAPGFDPLFGWGRMDAAAAVTDAWQNGGCGNLDMHAPTSRGSKIKSRIATHGVDGGKVTVTCSGDGGVFKKGRHVGEGGSARVKIKSVPPGVYRCSVTRVRDAAGRKVCRSEVRPVEVTVE